MTDTSDPVTEAETITYCADIERRAEWLANCYPDEPQQRARLIAVALAAEAYKAGRRAS